LSVASTLSLSVASSLSLKRRRRFFGCLTVVLSAASSILEMTPLCLPLWQLFSVGRLKDDPALSPSLSITMSAVSSLSLKRCGRFFVTMVVAMSAAQSVAQLLTYSVVYSVARLVVFPKEKKAVCRLDSGVRPWRLPCRRIRIARQRAVWFGWMTTRPLETGMASL
jgi:hypothetical protein